MPTAGGCPAAAVIGGEPGGGGGDGGVGGTVWTNMVQATGSGRLASKGSGKKDVYYPGSPNGLIEPAGPLSTQANINGWIVKALEELEEDIPSVKSTHCQTPGNTKAKWSSWPVVFTFGLRVRGNRSVRQKAP